METKRGKLGGEEEERAEGQKTKFLLVLREKDRANKNYSVVSRSKTRCIHMRKPKPLQSLGYATNRRHLYQRTRAGVLSIRFPRDGKLHGNWQRNGICRVSRPLQRKEALLCLDKRQVRGLRLSGEGRGIVNGDLAGAVRIGTATGKLLHNSKQTRGWRCSCCSRMVAPCCRE